MIQNWLITFFRNPNVSKGVSCIVLSDIWILFENWLFFLSYICLLQYLNSCFLRDLYNLNLSNTQKNFATCSKNRVSRKWRHSQINKASSVFNSLRKSTHHNSVVTRWLDADVQPSFPFPPKLFLALSCFQSSMQLNLQFIGKKAKQQTFGVH